VKNKKNFYFYLNQLVIDKKNLKTTLACYVIS